MKWVLRCKRNWESEFISASNPLQTTKSVHDARRFRSRAAAVAVKKGLNLRREFAAKKLPEWL